MLTLEKNINFVSIWWVLIGERQWVMGNEYIILLFVFFSL